MSMNIGDSGGDPIGRLQAGALAHRRPQKTRGCPDEDRLRMLLPGQVEGEEADELLTHAAECDWCGTVLREAAQDLIEPPTREEEELAGKARLADPRRRRKFAERIVKPAQDVPRPFYLRWGLAWSLATATLVAVGGVSYQQWARGTAHTERLLAEAYTKQRPMEMRVLGAAWGGHERTERGAGSPNLNEPRALLDARSNISRGIEEHPDDPKWLQLRGRAYLLEGNQEAAIVDLERAHTLRPADASILLDWGTALFRKGEGDDPEARAQAFERLKQGARLNPNDPVLLFNLALAAQSLPVPNEARDDWEAYLRIDSKGGWADEARRHLDEVKKNLSGSGTTPPPQNPTR
jgi:tetratricopeptide (TPR) repeat protein